MPKKLRTAGNMGKRGYPMLKGREVNGGIVVAICQEMSLFMLGAYFRSQSRPLSYSP